MTDVHTYQTPFARLLTLNGAVGGVSNVVGDYSATAKEAFFIAGAGAEIVIKRLNLRVKTAAGMVLGGYGSGAELINGITVYVKNAEPVTIADLTASHPIKLNEEWSDYITKDGFYFAESQGQWGYSCTWDFTQTGDIGGLFIPSLCKFAVGVNDDFTTRCSKQYFEVQGIYVRTELGSVYAVEKD